MSSGLNPNANPNPKHLKNLPVNPSSTSHSSSSSKWPVPKYNYHHSPDASIRRVRAFWFGDGSLVVRVQNRAFRVHRAVLERHSGRFLEGLVPYKQVSLCSCWCVLGIGFGDCFLGCWISILTDEIYVCVANGV